MIFECTVLLQWQAIHSQWWPLIPCALILPWLVYLWSRRRVSDRMTAQLPLMRQVLLVQQTKRRSEVIVLLCLRSLFLCTLTLAVMGVSRVSSGNRGLQQLHLIIDNGIASACVSSEGVSVLESRKNDIRRWLNTSTKLPPTTLWVTSGAALQRNDQPIQDKESILLALDQIHSTALKPSWSSIWNKISTQKSASRIMVFTTKTIGQITPVESLVETPRLTENHHLWVHAPSLEGPQSQLLSIEPQSPVLVRENISHSIYLKLSARRFGSSDNHAVQVQLQCRDVAGAPLGPAQEVSLRWQEGLERMAFNIPLQLNASQMDLAKQRGLFVYALWKDPLDSNDLDNHAACALPQIEQCSIALLSNIRDDRCRLLVDALSSPTEHYGYQVEIWTDQQGWPANWQQTRAIFVVQPQSLDANQWSKLRKWVEAGGWLWVFAPESQKLETALTQQRQGWGNNLFANKWTTTNAPQKIDQTQTPESLSALVNWKSMCEMVMVQSYLSPTITAATETWLRSASNDPLLASQSLGKGQLLVCGLSMNVTHGTFAISPLALCLWRESIKQHLAKSWSENCLSLSLQDDQIQQLTSETRAQLQQTGKPALAHANTKTTWFTADIQGANTTPCSPVLWQQHWDRLGRWNSLGDKIDSWQISTATPQHGWAGWWWCVFVLWFVDLLLCKQFMFVPKQEDTK